MELTQQQCDIIRSDENIKINAVAGSGKTTTIIEYAKTRPAGSRILYLAFNKSVKEEAIRKFSQRGIKNIVVETAHSLAYRYVVNGSGYHLKKNGYQIYEIAGLLNLEKEVGRMDAFILANHINGFVSYFCNSEKKKVNELNYVDVVSEPKAAGYVKSHYKYLLEKTRKFLALMDKREIEITHDFYLKKFQLLSPALLYDYILFDEGQDASAAMLDVFMKQENAIKVIVGDTHQQIYAWRFAVNSMEKVEFKCFPLTISFRFRQDIAYLGMQILAWKQYIGNLKQVNIVGRGNNDTLQSKAVIARTNLGLLIKAIECVVGNREIKRIYFEGNINSYLFADDGTSLYDILALYNDDKKKIRNKLIASMQNMQELEEYINNTGDMQLSMLVNIVKKYGKRIHDILKEIKFRHVDDKTTAQLIFSTVHRCKGMEYDTVELASDFITEEKLKGKETCGEFLSAIKLNEEINLLYVATTRTRNRLYIPREMLPEGFPDTVSIHTLDTENEMTNPIHLQDFPKKNKVKNEGKDKSYTVEEVRKKHKQAYQPWTEELDDELTAMYCENASIRKMAEYFGRTTGAIRSRIKKLELEELYG